VTSRHEEIRSDERTGDFFVGSAPVARPLDADWLEREMLIRGWSVSDLCRHARISHVTGSHARGGKRVDRGTVVKIAAALKANPPDPALADIAEKIK